MACGLEFRQPSAEIRKLWLELRLLNDDLALCVKTAEDYLKDLDFKVNTTKAYFTDIRTRISKIPTGDFTITADLDGFLKMGEDATHSYFCSLRTDAAEGFDKVSEERGEWMKNASYLMEKQLQVLDVLENHLPRLSDARNLKAKVSKTYRDIVSVEGEVKSLQKVLYDCEVAKAELEEDYVSLVKSYQELDAMSSECTENQRESTASAEL